LASEAGEGRTTRIRRDFVSLRALPVACSFICRTMRPSLVVLTTSEESQTTERGGGGREKRRRTRDHAVEEPGAMPCMYRYRSRHRGC
jgi:hypothetical protein